MQHHPPPNQNFVQQPPPPQPASSGDSPPRASANSAAAAPDDSGISTSGQVDEGQFRLVPNAPEDEYFNRVHPPRAAGGASSSSSSSVREAKAASASIYDNPQPGPSRAWGSSDQRALASQQQQQQPQQQASVNVPTRKVPDGYSSPPTHGNGNGNGRLDGSAAESGAGPSNNNLDGLLPCPADDLQLSSSFMMDPVELEDIQLQNFAPPEQQQQQGVRTERSVVEVQHPVAGTSKPPNGSSEHHHQQQHSSILESMTGPLSKRLRTLHNLQQKKSSSSSSQPQAGTSSAAASVPPPPLPPVRIPPRDAEPKKAANNNNSEAAASSSGIPPPFANQLSDSDSNHSNGGGGGGGNNGNGDVFPHGGAGGGNGGTQHTYNVSLEHQQALPPSVILKPKRIFEKKMWGGGEDGDENEEDDDLEPRKVTHPELVENRRQRKQQDFDVLSRPRRAPKAPSRIWEMSSQASSSAAMTITDAPVQSRARASLPSTHLAIRELPRRGPGSGPGVGVFAKRRIPRGCRFGPMEGVARKDHERSAAEGGGELVLVIKGEGGSSVLDTSDDGMLRDIGFVNV